jgi:hypothetical protein
MPGLLSPVMVKGPAGEPPYDWINTSQAADRLGIAHRTLYRRIERAGQGTA